MDSRLKRDARARGLRCLTPLLVVIALGLTACGGDDGGPGDGAGAPESSAPSSPSGEEQQILIKTDVELKVEDPRYNSKAGVASGKVATGSTLGDSPFCVGGTIRDRHGSDAIGGLVDRTIECPDGTIRMVFTPGVPQGLTQEGGWRVAGGTGAYEGLQGYGEMKIVYAGKTSGKGHETFTGTVEL